jgi:hypothetical protein
MRFGRQPDVAQAPAATAPPREIYVAAAEEIARHFAPRGWRFARSGPHLSRGADGFRCKIAFQSSHYNTAGHVALSVYTLVHASGLKRWRAAHESPLRRDDIVAAGGLWHLHPEAHHYQWNVADPAGRPTAIAEIVERIESLALPWFSLFFEREALVARLGRGLLPNVAAANAIEMLLWLDEPEVAAAQLRYALDDHATRDAYQAARRSPPQYANGNRPAELALVARQYGLD